MFMFVTTLVFIFIIRLRFPSKVSIATIISYIHDSPRKKELAIKTFYIITKLATSYVPIRKNKYPKYISARFAITTIHSKNTTGTLLFQVKFTICYICSS